MWVLDPGAAPSPTPIPLRAAGESLHPVLSEGQGGLMENPDCTPQLQLPTGGCRFWGPLRPRHTGTGWVRGAP